MTDKSDKFIAGMINELRRQRMNDIEIANDFLGGGVAVMIDAVGTKPTAEFLRSLAEQVDLHTQQVNRLN